MKTKGTRAEQKVKTEDSASVSLSESIKVSKPIKRFLEQKKLDTDADSINDVIAESLGVKNE